MSDNPSYGTTFIVARFRELFSEGLPFNDIRHQLSTEGFSLSSTLARDIYAQLRDPNRLGVEFVPENQIPNPEIFKSSSIPLTSEYRSVVSYSARDLLTGEQYEGIFALDTDELTTIGEWKAAIAQTIEEDYYQGRLVRVEAVDFLNIYKR